MMGLAFPSFYLLFSLFLLPPPYDMWKHSKKGIEASQEGNWSKSRRVLTRNPIVHHFDLALLASGMTTCGTKRVVLYLLMRGNFRKTSTCFLYDLLDVGSTLTASSFRIFNNSPPLALFLVMLPKGHLTLYSRMSGSMWVSPASSSSRSLRPFFI